MGHMNWIETVSFYTAILIILLVVHSVRVIRARFAGQVGLGDGNNARLLQAMRIHGNFTEYVPIAIIGLWLVAAQSAPVWSLHALGAALVFGRVMHMVGLTLTSGSSWQRVGGMMLTFSVLLVEAGLLLYYAVTG